MTIEELMEQIEEFSRDQSAAEWQETEGWSEVRRISCRKNADESRINLRKTLEILIDENNKLRQALEKLARLGNGELYGNSVGNVIAQDALR